MYVFRILMIYLRPPDLPLLAGAELLVGEEDLMAGLELRIGEEDLMLLGDGFRRVGLFVLGLLVGCTRLVGELLVGCCTLLGVTLF